MKKNRKKSFSSALKILEEARWQVFVRLNGDGKMEASSAGTMPVKEVNPMDIQVMREKSMALSANRPKLITNQMVQEANMIIVRDAAP